MASADDINSTLQGLVRNVGQCVSLLTQYVAPGQTPSTAASPAATLFTALSTTSVGVIGTSTLRRGLVFLNPNPSGVNMWVVPSNVTAVINQGVPLTPGSSYTVPSTLHCNAAWNAIAASGTNNVLTILEFF
jgi:hypothetical protein